MKIADFETIENEPISSINLMERASTAFCDCFRKIYDTNLDVYVFCGIGNNGGDGLAIARILHTYGYTVFPIVIGDTTKGSADFKLNLSRIQNQLNVEFPQSISEISLNSHSLIIDGLLGSGLNRPLKGFVSEIIDFINNTNFPIISIDIASGLYADKTSEQNQIVKPNFTFTFQSPKLAFMMPENEDFIGELKIIDIGVKYENYPSKFYYTCPENIQPPSRKRFSHKGSFGHGLLIAGSAGMLGAAILASKACMRSGIGKLSLCTINAIESLNEVPEIILKNHFNLDFNQYQAIGIGCGIGVFDTAKNLLIEVLNQDIKVPIIIDADAITLIGQENLIAKLPAKTILTPHLKEFKAICKKSWQNDFEKIEILSEFSVEHQLIICLKGKNTAIALPDGSVHFNSTGNSGMATAGSGDVLTGIILGFLAQGYSPSQAAIQGVFEHGLAGDRAANLRSERAIIASDIIENFR